MIRRDRAGRRMAEKQKSVQKGGHGLRGGSGKWQCSPGVWEEATALLERASGEASARSKSGFRQETEGQPL